MMKSTLFITLIMIVIGDIIGHNELSSSIQDSDSDSMPEAITKMRRRMDSQQWQYEGIPIDFPIRRNIGHADKQMKPIKRNNVPTTEATSTSIDYRYRRVFNPDESASVDDHPYMAALLVNAELWCGAVVITADSALTAAHCLQLQYNNRFFREYVKMLSLRVGSSNATAGGELYRVTEISFHPNYKPQTLAFNLALLKVHKNMTFGREPKVDSIGYSRDRVVPVDSQILFLGWGSVIGYEGTGGQVLLQKVRLPVYDLADCQEVYGRDLVSRNNFCAGYITLAKNVCNHDAGGPAILNGMLVGILSFSSQRCDLPDQPAVFTTVAAIAPWLDGLLEKQRIRHTAIKAP